MRNSKSGYENNKEVKDNPEKKLPARVYYVSSPEDNTVLIGMDVVINQDTKTVRWFDTVKERVMSLEEIKMENDSEFTFRTPSDEGGKIYTFTPLTLETYKNKIKNKLPSPRDFDNEEEMFRAFEETKKNVW